MGVSPHCQTLRREKDLVLATKAVLNVEINMKLHLVQMLSV